MTTNTKNAAQRAYEAWCEEMYQTPEWDSLRSGEVTAWWSVALAAADDTSELETLRAELARVTAERDAARRQSHQYANELMDVGEEMGLPSVTHAALLDGVKGLRARVAALEAQAADQRYALGQTMRWLKDHAPTAALAVAEAAYLGSPPPADDALCGYAHGDAERARLLPERVRNAALEEAMEALGAEFRALAKAFPEPCERRSGILDMHAAGAAGISALKTGGA